MKDDIKFPTVIFYFLLSENVSCYVGEIDNKT